MKKVTYEEFKNAVQIIKLYEQQIKSDYNFIISEIPVIKHNNVNKETRIIDTELSSRAINCIAKGIPDKYNYEITIEDVSNLSVTDLKKISGAGDKTIKEIKELCNYAGLDLFDHSIKLKLNKP
jgi:DNA-directed RNA polymerase alpha subunit